MPHGSTGQSDGISIGSVVTNRHTLSTPLRPTSVGIGRISAVHAMRPMNVKSSQPCGPINRAAVICGYAVSASCSVPVRPSFRSLVPIHRLLLGDSDTREWSCRESLGLHNRAVATNRTQSDAPLSPRAGPSATTPPISRPIGVATVHPQACVYWRQLRGYGRTYCNHGHHNLTISAVAAGLNLPLQQLYM